MQSDRSRASLLANPVRPRSRRWCLRGLVCLACLLLARCEEGSRPTPASGSGAAPARETAGSAESCEARGRVYARKSARFYLEGGRSVSSLRVENGQVVEEGEPLYELEDRSLDEEILKLRLQVAQFAQAAEDLQVLEAERGLRQEDLKKIGEGMERDRQLGEEVPEFPVAGRLRSWEEKQRKCRGELELLDVRIAIGKARVDRSARLGRLCDERLRSLEEERRKLTVVAPFGGRVTRLREGGRNPDDPDLLLELEDDSALYIEARVWQQQMGMVRVGDPATVLVDFFDNQSLPAVVESIGPVCRRAVTDYAQYPVRLDLDGPAGELRPGMLVTVRLGVGAGGGGR